MKRILKALLKTIIAIIIPLLCIAYAIAFFYNRTIWDCITLGLVPLGVIAFIFWKFYEMEDD